MPYIKSDRPVGRPRKYPSRADEPARLSIRLSHALRRQLLATAQQQQCSVTTLAIRILTAHFAQRGPLDVIDNALTVAAKVLGHLEAALSPDHPLMAHVNALYDALTPISEALDPVLQKEPQS